MGCGNKPTLKENLSLYDEVMSVHDSIMPEINTIHGLKRDLKAIQNPEAHTIILDKVKILDEADEAMMSWMAAFKVPAEAGAEKKYLEDEKIKIQNVSNSMRFAISSAQQLLDSLKQNSK